MATFADVYVDWVLVNSRKKFVDFLLYVCNKSVNECHMHVIPFHRQICNSMEKETHTDFFSREIEKVCTVDFIVNSQWRESSLLLVEFVETFTPRRFHGELFVLMVFNSIEMYLSKCCSIPDDPDEIVEEVYRFVKFLGLYHYILCDHTNISTIIESSKNILYSVKPSHLSLAFCKWTAEFTRFDIENYFLFGYHSSIVINTVGPTENIFLSGVASLLTKRPHNVLQAHKIHGKLKEFAYYVKRPMTADALRSFIKLSTANVEAISHGSGASYNCNVKYPLEEICERYILPELVEFT